MKKLIITIFAVAGLVMCMCQQAFAPPSGPQEQKQGQGSQRPPEQKQMLPLQSPPLKAAPAYRATPKLPDCVATQVYSSSDSDYRLALKINESANTYQVVFYGMLASGQSFANLKTFEDVYANSSYPNNLQNIKDKIKGERMLVWMETHVQNPRWPGVWITTDTPVAVLCQALTKPADTDTEPFRCVGVDSEKVNLKTYQQIIADKSLSLGLFFFKTADKYADDSIKFTFAKWAGNDADDDLDGVPNALDSCSSKATFDAPEEACPVEVEKQQQGDSVKCTDTPAGVAVDINGCPVTSGSGAAAIEKTGEGVTVEPLKSESGCAFVPASSASSITLGMLATALLALICRKNKN